MSETLTFLLAGTAGFLLGIFFFGGLWWTVRKGVLSPRPALWFLGSTLLRMGVAIVGFYFVGGEQWQRWLGCIIGFVAARFIVLRLTRPLIEHHSASTKEAHHAP